MIMRISKFYFFCFLVLFCFGLPGCSLISSDLSDSGVSDSITIQKYRPDGDTNYDVSMRDKMDKYATASITHFMPFFISSRLPLISANLGLVVLKREKIVQVYALHEGAWHYIAKLPILEMSGHAGPKLKSGDLQVPEGIYKIIALNPNSRYFLSMMINYPNAFDKLKAKESGRQDLGDNIFIHGSDQSVGCVAIGDKGIAFLFPLVFMYSQEHLGETIPVVIAPYDFRQEPILVPQGSLPWVKQLYTNIAKKLRQFPLAAKA
jgi:hypothetical protein